MQAVRGKGGGHTAIFKDFLSAIVKGTPLLAPGVEGIRGLELSNAMLLSTWTGSWVDIPVDEDLYYEKLKERIASSRHKKKAGEDRTLDVAGTH